ncbi:MAG: 16S rRNA (guanine(966)-N(2))-methyltransferase RsmD [Clostridia bacterium]|nr:16S rRNA (guanine(966)-N(2))-methyltransferase RsmD [Clostridia bacterium]
MRIVAGKHRGMQLYTFDADNIRPTTDRVRENIFNKLQFGIQNSSVLDLFCGTGAVSLEFLSRGAREVVSVDNNKASISLIKQNFKKAKETPNLVEKDYIQALNTLKNNAFDYIFLDPPYATDFGDKALKIIAEFDILAQDGLIIYEHLVDKNFSIPNGYELLDAKKYGTIVVSYIGRRND